MSGVFVLGDYDTCKTTISNTANSVNSIIAGTGISVDSNTGDVTVTNVGVLTISAGTGIDITDNIITNTGVASINAGDGIRIDNGDTIVNTGVLTISAGDGIDINGTTITNTNNFTSIVAGTNISIDTTNPQQPVVSANIPYGTITTSSASGNTIIFDSVTQALQQTGQVYVSSTNAIRITFPNAYAYSAPFVSISNVNIDNWDSGTSISNVSNTGFDITFNGSFTGVLNWYAFGNNSLGSNTLSYYNVNHDTTPIFYLVPYFNLFYTIDVNSFSPAIFSQDGIASDIVQFKFIIQAAVDNTDDYTISLAYNASNPVIIYTTQPINNNTSTIISISSLFLKDLPQSGGVYDDLLFGIYNNSDTQITIASLSVFNFLYYS